MYCANLFFSIFDYKTKQISEISFPTSEPLSLLKYDPTLITFEFYSEDNDMNKYIYSYNTNKWTQKSTNDTPEQTIGNSPEILCNKYFTYEPSNKFHSQNECQVDKFGNVNTENYKFGTGLFIKSL